MELELCILSMLRIAFVAFPIFMLPNAIFKAKEAWQENNKKKMSSAVAIIVSSIFCVGMFFKMMKGIK